MNKEADIHAARSRAIAELRQKCTIMRETLQNMEALLRQMTQIADEEYLHNIHNKKEEEDGNETPFHHSIRA